MLIGRLGTLLPPHAFRYSNALLWLVVIAAPVRRGPYWLIVLRE